MPVPPPAERPGRIQSKSEGAVRRGHAFAFSRFMTRRIEGEAQAAFKRDLQFYEKYGLLKDEKFNVKVYTGSHTERMEVA